MKKVKSASEETIKFRPDVRIISITPEGVVVDEATASVIEARLGSQVVVEDTDEVATPESAEVVPGEEVAEVKAEDEVKPDVDPGDKVESSDEVKTEDEVLSE